jgi:hypothetical protein
LEHHDLVPAARKKRFADIDIGDFPIPLWQEIASAVFVQYTTDGNIKTIKDKR